MVKSRIPPLEGDFVLIPGFLQIVVSCCNLTIAWTKIHEEFVLEGLKMRFVSNKAWRVCQKLKKSEKIAQNRKSENWVPVYRKHRFSLVRNLNSPYFARRNACFLNEMLHTSHVKTDILMLQKTVSRHSFFNMGRLCGALWAPLGPLGAFQRGTPPFPGEGYPRKPRFSLQLRFSAVISRKSAPGA